MFKLWWVPFEVRILQWWLALLISPLLACGLLYWLAAERPQTQWPEVQGVVTKSELEAHGGARLARVEISYDFGGERYTTSQRRKKGGQPERSKKGIEREKEFLADYPLGAKRSVWLFPLLVAPGHTRAVMILPHEFWSDDLREWWLAQA